MSSILRNTEINIKSKGRDEIDHYTTETKEIEINKISQNPFQPRHQFDISKLDELAHSINWSRFGEVTVDKYRYQTATKDPAWVLQ